LGIGIMGAVIVGVIGAIWLVNWILRRRRRR
jgi:hypothetical protein